MVFYFRMLETLQHCRSGSIDEIFTNFTKHKILPTGNFTLLLVFPFRSLFTADSPQPLNETERARAFITVNGRVRWRWKCAVNVEAVRAITEGLPWRNRFIRRWASYKTHNHSCFALHGDFVTVEHLSHPSRQRLLEFRSYSIERLFIFYDSLLGMNDVRAGPFHLWRA